jgi:hypothetical protein
MSEDHKISLGHFHTYNPGTDSSLVKIPAKGNISTIQESDAEDSVPTRTRRLSEDEKGLSYRQPKNQITQPGITVKSGEGHNEPFNRRNYEEEDIHGYGNKARYQISPSDAEFKDSDEEQLAGRFANPDNFLEILANHARSKNTRRGSRFLANPELIEDEEQGVGYEKKEEARSPHKVEAIKHEKADEIIEPIKHEKIEPIKHEKIEPIKHEKLETFKSEKIETIKHEKIETIEHEKLESLNHEKLESLNHEKLESFKPELEEPYQPDKVEEYQYHKIDTFEYKEPKMSYSKSQDTPASITLSINSSSSLLSPKSPNFQEIPSDLSNSHPQSNSNPPSKDFSTFANHSQSSSDSDPESSHPANTPIISNIEQPPSKPLSDHDSSSDEEPIAPVPTPSLHVSGPRGTLAGLLPNSNSKSDMIDRNMQKSGLVVSERTSNCASCSVF